MGAGDATLTDLGLSVYDEDGVLIADDDQTGAMPFVQIPVSDPGSTGTPTFEITLTAEAGHGDVNLLVCVRDLGSGPEASEAAGLSTQARRSSPAPEGTVDPLTRRPPSPTPAQRTGEQDGIPGIQGGSFVMQTPAAPCHGSDETPLAFLEFFAAWNEKHSDYDCERAVPGRHLAQGASYVVAAMLDAGHTYRVVGKGDTCTADIDLYLYDGAGRLLGSDTGPDAFPNVDVAPSRTGEHSIKLVMKRGDGFTGVMVCLDEG